MDANHLTFHLLSRGTDYDLSRGGLAWDAGNGLLHLGAGTPARLPADRNAARLAAEGRTITMDSFGTWAGPTPDGSGVLAAGALSDTVSIYTAPAGTRIRDLAMGDDGILYIVLAAPETDAVVIMQDQKGRWPNHSLSVRGFSPDRITAVSGGGALALDRNGRRLARIAGQPLRKGPQRPYCPGTSRPCEENPDPPRMTPIADAPLPADREIVAVAAAPEGGAAILMWPSGPESDAEIARYRKGRIRSTVTLKGARAPFSLGWLEKNVWALLFHGHNQAVAYDLDGGQGDGIVQPAPHHYPLMGWTGEPFVNAPARPVHYPSTTTGSGAAPRPLNRLSLNAYALSGQAEAGQFLDSGAFGTVWHRIYLEAVIPPGTGVCIFLAAVDDQGELPQAPEMEHRFGQPAAEPSAVDVPVGAWVESPSELAYHPGLLPCPPQRDRAGLFTVLIQRPGRQVRTLAGRFLRLRVALTGNGQTTPQIAAIRIWAPRFSYLDHYLPHYYREGVRDAAADDSAPATGSDFLQRYLGLFESVLTPLEDRVANAWMVTDPAGAPTDALEWLGSWIGLALEKSFSTAVKRNMLAAATRLYRRRGTLDGLEEALDIATPGMVTSGELVILEDFRLRRILATILGADLDDEENPLTLGTGDSGNSIIGRTLFLGDEEQAELAALYRPGALGKGGEEAVLAFLAQLAHRITLLVHARCSGEKVKMIRHIARRLTPAHVAVRISTASRGLRLGMAALLGVDTRPAGASPRRDATVGTTVIGRGDCVQGAPSLDPRLTGGGGSSLTPGWERPKAHAGEDQTRELGRSFTLDGSRSRAFGGLELDAFYWTKTK